MRTVYSDWMDLLTVVYSEKILFCASAVGTFTETLIPFTMLYGLLEDFFEENEIYISISLNLDKINCYVKINNNELGTRAIMLQYEAQMTKKYAMEQGILAACKLLESKL